MKQFFSDWKTTITGLLIAAVVVFYMMGKIDGEDLPKIAGFLIATGFILSGDSKRSKKKNGENNQTGSTG